MTAHRTRATARLARVQGPRSWYILDAWCAGAVLVPCDTEVLVRATGLSADRLLGEQLTVRVDLGALIEEELRPAGWVRARAPGCGRTLPA